jgi:reverse gyrase
VITLIVPVYRWSCPNCGGPISAERLEKGLPCERCLPTVPKNPSVKSVAYALMKRGMLKGYAWLYQLQKDYEDFERFFLQRTGKRLWSAQKGWARRLLMMESLEIVAPTGVGKTTLLMTYASYVAEKRGWKVLYLVPTENLVRQVSSNIRDLTNLKDKVIAYYSGMSKGQKEETINRILNGDFEILVITTGFLQKRFEDLKKISPFDLIVVDDVDSLLRQSKNIERVLELLGYPQEVINLALDLVNTKLKLFKSLALGKDSKVEELQKKVAELESKLRNMAPTPRGQLVIASATGRPKGHKHLIFKELLGFEIGGTTDYMRNVIDSYIVSEKPLETVVDVVKRLGRGGVIFVSQSLGKPIAKVLAKRLEESGIKARVAVAGARRAVELLATGKIDVIVGVASRYGVIVRGLDLPEVIKYAVFVDVPSRKVRLQEALIHPLRLLRVLLFLGDKGDKEAESASKELIKALEKISEPSLIVSVLKGKLKAEGVLKDVANLVITYSDLALKKVIEMLTEKDVVKIGSTVVTKEGNEYYMYIIDAPTYLQASGRTSRLLNGRMTLGLSVIIDSHKERIDALKERLSWLAKTNFVKFDDLKLDEVMKSLEATRRGEGKKVNVKTALLIVESPTKAKTIAWFWGRPSRRKFGRVTAYETSVYDEKDNTIYLLTTVASRGHIYDLAVDEDSSIYGVKYEDGVYKPVYTTIKRCLKCGYQFTEEVDKCPRCGSEYILDSKSIIDILRKLAVEVDEVIIATDPDREGEKIGWDIALALKPFNRNISRARFHEITPHAVLEAIRNRGPFERRLVNAQIVRRIEDRWIGFGLSEHLKNLYNKRWLGAGRVQTPVLGWIISRYKEWKDNRGYLIIATLENNKKIKFFTLEKREIDDEEVIVKELETWETVLKPLPPFTTDSLLYEAQRSFGLPSWVTMKLAQDLFETGLITYHRTDSIRVSATGIALARSYLERKGLSHLYEGRGWSDEGAHEAIRPTRPLDVEELERAIIEGSLRVPIKLSRLHFKLYDLIFRRFMASQMKPSKVVNVRVVFSLGGLLSEIERPAKVIERGFTEIYDPGLEPWLLQLRIGQKLKVTSLKFVRSSSVRLLTTGDVVKLMKENGIGRPSTYSKVIESNIRHGYVIVSKKRGYLVPTKLGINVHKYLIENFGDLVSVETTRKLEEELDKIERGEVSPIEVLENLWKDLGKRNLIIEKSDYILVST